MRKRAATAAAVALAATATPSQASSAVAASFPCISVRGGASFHPDNKDHKKTTTTPKKGKKKKRSTQRKSEKTTTSANDKKETTASKTSAAEQEQQEEQEATSSNTSTTPQQKPSPQDALIKQLLKEEDYYAILGVPKTASAQQIQKAYRRRAVQTHPDKLESKDRRAFDKVAQAYDVLSDDSKRSIYNRYGKKGLDSTKEGRPPSSFTEDIFRSFFGSGSGMQRPSAPRNRTVRYQLEVTLEELYMGTLKHVVVTEPDRKRLEISVERGMASGQSIVLSGEMDHVPHATPADLVFVIQQRPHAQFTRKGHDLATELVVSLQEAICGMTRTLQHLDGRKIHISSARHLFSSNDSTPMLIQTGDVHVLKGEGMPKPGETDQFGDLYVQYKVEMPTQQQVNRLSREEREQLGELLGKLDDDKERHTHNKNDKNVKVMQKASPADGRASGPFRVDNDYYEEEFEQQHGRFPFGGGGYRQFHFSGGGPFFGFGGTRPNDDDGNVQCQHM